MDIFSFFAFFNVSPPKIYYSLRNFTNKKDALLRRQSLYHERFIRIISIKDQPNIVPITIQIYLFTLISIPKRYAIPRKIKAINKATPAFFTVAKYFFINYSPRVQAPLLLFSITYFPFFQSLKYQNNTSNH